MKISPNTSTKELEEHLKRTLSKHHDVPFHYNKYLMAQRWELEHGSRVLPDDGFADGGERYTDEELDLMNREP